jgi:hypothetical protein
MMTMEVVQRPAVVDPARMGEFILKNFGQNCDMHIMKKGCKQASKCYLLREG